MSVRSSRLAAGLVFSLLVSASAAYAESIEGRVVDVRPGTLELTVYDPQGRPYPNNLHLKTDAYTRLRGVTSLEQLRRQDPVSVDVTQEESQMWRADEITRFADVSLQPATQNPPPTMRDVLGNPVVRGALIGAATGAIASSASGGKAGKGALVGAGVGAAAGLLGGLFGGSDSNQ
ncbi:MAG: hypothetical protein MOGMAGMI_00090 [Candidatus Omnitrophica bacterium]|nr:hypothetical protein [Candidatus Omnitrophota bacterium]